MSSPTNTPPPTWPAHQGGDFGLMDFEPTGTLPAFKASGAGSETAPSWPLPSAGDVGVLGGIDASGNEFGRVITWGNSKTAAKR